MLSSVMGFFQGVVGQGAEERRRRKLIGLLALVGLVSLVSGTLQLFHGVISSAVASLGMVLANLALLYALRRGASMTLVTVLFLTIGELDTVMLAMRSGHEGVRIVLWLTIAPVIALTVAGRRAGWVTLFISAAMISLTSFSLHQHWVDAPVLDTPAGPTAISGIGLLAAIFFIVRLYEDETERGLEHLRTQNAALEQARLDAERARALAVEANRAKSDFVATISHELRTPLNGVIGMAALLHSEREPTQLREGLRVIQSSADTLRALISDVLDFAKIENGKLELYPSPFSAEELLKTSAAVIRPSLQPGVSLDVHVASSVPPWLLGDVARVRQVLLNLLNNAAKFTHDGRIECLASYAHDALQLSVTDTGIGMSKEQAASVGSEAFQQLDRGATRSYGGVGLGLSISRRLLSLMQGSLTVDSERGHGSTFTVTVPMPRAEAPKVEALADRKQGQLHVLVAEDNPINQLVVRKLLERLGHRVTLAANGRLAVDALAAGASVDVVLMDCHMPELDGFEATRQLRAAGHRVPIYALTASVSVDDLQRCLTVGMDEVLAKPLDVERLKEVLGRHAQRAA